MADIFDELKKDHDRQRDMLRRLGEHPGDAAACRKLFEAFRIDATAHAAAEEESLYAEMLGRPEMRDEGRHSVAEHKEIDDYFEELAESDFAGDAWQETFAKLRHRYEHHIDEEEEEIFAAAREGLSAERSDALAEKFRNRKPAEVAAVEADG